VTEEHVVERLRPLPREDWGSDMDAALKVRSVGAPAPRRPIPADRPRAENMTGMFANHPALAEAYFTFNAHILWRTTLTARQRELVILRVAALRSARYLFAQHVHMAREAEISDEELERTKVGPEAAGWEPFDRTLLTAADELIGSAKIGDDTWVALREQLDTHQLMDLVYTIGAYEVLSFAENSFGLEIDADLEPTTPKLG
jgi:alkylhydroperoxidase family enzyme